MKYFDVHTHTIPSDKDITAILSIDLHKDCSLRNILKMNILFDEKMLFSIGIHPWYPDKSLMDIVKKTTPCKNIVSIGETGLDKLVAKE
jgi:Tat protein secretion system quality control protein TatD with DNase activity